uniref:Uncharacterized protein n=1 Tax=Setaria viridis TaxID=4556 RepID=A0A4U6V8W4_SETVI|nr:hypothetical protein SEVIR_3G137300v2 [Setaria viridis]
MEVKVGWFLGEDLAGNLLLLPGLLRRRLHCWWADSGGGLWASDARRQYLWLLFGGGFFVGLLLVGWGWTVGRSVSDPGDDEEMACHLLGHSTDQRHAHGVLLVGLLKIYGPFVDSGCDCELHYKLSSLLREAEKNRIAVTLVGDGEVCWVLISRIMRQELCVKVLNF